MFSKNHLQYRETIQYSTNTLYDIIKIPSKKKKKNYNYFYRGTISIHSFTPNIRLDNWLTVNIIVYHTKAIYREKGVEKN